MTQIKKVTSSSTPEVAERVDALYQSIIEVGIHRATQLGFKPEVILSGRNVNYSIPRFIVS